MYCFRSWRKEANKCKSCDNTSQRKEQRSHIIVNISKKTKLKICFALDHIGKKLQNLHENGLYLSWTESNMFLQYFLVHVSLQNLHENSLFLSWNEPNTAIPVRNGTLTT